MSRSLSLILLLVCSQSLLAAPKVLVSIQPLQLIAQSILGQQGTSEALLPPGSSPHSFSLRPSDSRRMAQADAFFWIGPDMENFLQKLAERKSQQSHALQAIPGLELLYYDEAHEHGEHELKQHDHDHLPGALDAHLWLSSHNARVIAAYMADEFTRLQPSAAEYYQANLQAFQRELDELDKELSQWLQPVQGKPFFVFHEAFNYLEHRYGLEHRGVFALSADVQPGARHMQQMRQVLEQAGASCIFYEPPAAPRLAHSLAKDLPVRLQELDPLGSKVDSYPALLQSMAVAMQQCLADL